MKYKTIIKEDIEERVEIYAKSRTKLIEQIESLCENDEIELKETVDEGIELENESDIPGDEILASDEDLEGMSEENIDDEDNLDDENDEFFGDIMDEDISDEDIMNDIGSDEE